MSILRGTVISSLIFVYCLFSCKTAKQACLLHFNFSLFIANWTFLSFIIKHVVRSFHHAAPFHACVGSVSALLYIKVTSCWHSYWGKSSYNTLLCHAYRYFWGSSAQLWMLQLQPTDYVDKHLASQLVNSSAEICCFNHPSLGQHNWYLLSLHFSFLDL